MKPRTAEASRLEESYVARVRSALAGRESSEVDEIVQSVRTHIEEELSGKSGEEVSAVEMANLLDQLGPPEAYLEKDNADAEASQQTPAKSCTSPLAIISLVCSLLSVVLGPFGCIPGIVCGHVALGQCRRDRELGGRSLAKAGMIIGYVFVTWWALIGLVALSFIGLKSVRSARAAPVASAPPLPTPQHTNSGNSEAALRSEILSWTNLDNVVKQLKLDTDLKTAADWQSKYETLRKAITVKVADQGAGVDMIEIAVTDKNPMLAQQIANAIADNYASETAKARNDDLVNEVDFLKKNEADNLETPKRTDAELANVKSQIQSNSGDLTALGAKEKDLQKTRDEAEEAREQYHKTLLALQDKLKDHSGSHGVQVEIVARALIPALPYNALGDYRASALIKRKDLGLVAR